MGSHSVTCHPAEVTFPPLPQPIEAGTRVSDPGGMQGWVDLVGLFTYPRWCTRSKTDIHNSVKSEIDCQCLRAYSLLVTCRYCDQRNVSVCPSVGHSISKTTSPNFNKFSISIAVTQSFSDDNATRYALPVSWMTPHFIRMWNGAASLFSVFVQWPPSCCTKRGWQWRTFCGGWKGKQCQHLCPDDTPAETEGPIVSLRMHRAQACQSIQYLYSFKWCATIRYFKIPRYYNSELSFV